MRNILILIGVVVGIVAITMGGSALGFWQMEIFGARTENVRNNIYKHSTAHVEGTVRELRRYKIEYLQAINDDSKHAIATMIIREADNISDDELPSDLARFVSDLRNNP